MKKLSYIFLVMFLVSSGAKAQKLWGEAVFGMTPAQVIQTYPQATPIESAIDKGYSSSTMDFIALGEIPSTVRFKFLEQRLYGVDWVFKTNSSFDANRSNYEELLAGMKREHPEAGYIQQHRTPEYRDVDRAKLLQAHVEWLEKQSRFYSDKWHARDGIDVSMSMWELERGGALRLSILTSNEEALTQLRAALAQIKQDERMASIGREKEADERRHSDFFEGFVGKNIKVLAADIGAPTTTTVMPKGEIIYVWESSAGSELRCRTSVFTKKMG